MIKACAYCKRKYKAERKERKFCSRACRNKAYPLNQKHKRTGKEQGCPVCGKVFYVPGHMLKPVNYCSRSCASRARRGDLNPNFRNGQNVKVDKICETCGQRFFGYARRKYCSPACAAKGHSQQSSRKVSRRCDFCGKEFWIFPSRLKFGPARYCSTRCASLARRADPGAAIWLSKRRYALARHKEWARAVKERDGYRCQECGATERLHAHHIRDFASYIEGRFDLTNGITLCLQCHLKAHYG